ncbi:SAF domain-containing protein [Mobilicoccus massiliensis]|uniref:SAF domain-containing protein n=1 Tax=Mobilicoccus massiliensis TaxID=1522310 RepID=UPI0015969701|nr:SAF domain-containing protein [Mobilicoccus massiliensis]
MGAAVLAAVAVWIALGVLRPGPAPHAVLTTARDLPAGHVLAAADLATAHVEDQLLPAEAARDPAAVVGRRLARPVSTREILTTRSLTATHALDATERAVHVPVADPGPLLVLRPGDRVDLVDGGKGTVVARNVLVLGVDDPGAEKGGHGLLVAVRESGLGALVPAMSANGAGVTPALRKQ